MRWIKLLLKILWQGWKKLLHFVGEVNATVLLTLLLIFVLFPVKLMLILTRKMPIAKRFKTEEPTYWVPKEIPRENSLSNQF